MPTMKIITKNAMVPAICALVVLGAPAAKFVDFDADAISNVLRIDNGFAFSGGSATLDSATSPGYSGPPVYGGFEKGGSKGGAWIASNRANAGLKLRWNANAGVGGEVSSGLFLFSQDDFLRGLRRVTMDAGNDTLSGMVGYINPGEPGDPAVSSARIRFVIKDDSGYHISADQPLVSNAEFSYKATTLSYFSFTPTVNTPPRAGTIGASSTPTFTGITWIGFRIDAVRGSNVSQGVNIGVTRFLAEDNTSVTVAVGASERRQVVYGFGAGMKRQVSELRLLGEPARTEVLNLMFRDVDTRILRTFLRHNHEEAGNDNDDPFDLNLLAMNLDNTYWEHVWLMQQARSIGQGKIDTIYASCNTAPSWMKDNGSIMGGKLLSEYQEEFAEFLWGYLYWMQKVKGYTIGALSMFNEPDYLVDHHESMNAGPVQAANILSVVGSSLKARFAAEPGLVPPLILGPDVGIIRNAEGYFDAIVANPGAFEAVDVFASHYYGPRSPGEWVNIKQLAGNRMVWQTEWADLKNAGDGMADALNLAERMHDVFNAGGHAYVAFQWIRETTDPKEGAGLIRIDRATNSYVVPKRYHVFKQFANSVPRNSRRVVTTLSSPNLLSTSYVVPDGSALVIQVINNSGSAENGSFYCPGMANGPVRRLRTSSSNNAAELAPVDGRDEAFSDRIHNATFSTYIVPLRWDFDSNSNGFPDGWEREYFGTLDTAAGRPNNDADGDGLTNLQEYIAGTDPTDANSFFSVAMENSSIAIPSMAGRLYTIENTPSLLPPSWSSVSNLPGTGDALLVDVGASGTNGFYRVKINLSE